MHIQARTSLLILRDLRAARPGVFTSQAAHVMVRKFIIVFLQKTNTSREAARPPFFWTGFLFVVMCYLMYN